MNSIATPRRIDTDLIEWGLGRLQTLAAAAIFTLLLISFKPYSGEIAKAGESGGDIVNQLGFGSIGLFSVAALTFLVNRDVSRQLVSIWWWLLFAFGLLSVQQSYMPDAALRAYLFTLFALAGVMVVLTLPTGASGLQRTLVIGSIITLALCYAGLVLYPDLARHTAFGTREPEHAGLWRGIYSHKNIAAPVMAVIAFIGIYAVRRGSWLVGAALVAAGFFFVANTGSKTTAGLVPLVMMLVMVPGIFGVRKLAAIVVFFTIAGAILATIGTELLPPLKALRETWAPTLTYTGRTQIWEFGLSHIMDHPLRGFGFESFWLSPFVQAQEVSFEATWDVRGIIHGHNGYSRYRHQHGCSGRHDCDNGHDCRAVAQLCTLHKLPRKCDRGRPFHDDLYFHCPQCLP